MSLRWSRLGRGEKGMQLLVPTSHDPQETTSKQFSKQCTTYSTFPVMQLLQLLCWPRQIPPGLMAESSLTHNFPVSALQVAKAQLSPYPTLLPEGPGSATVSNHSNTVLTGWKSYFRSLEISRGQAVNALCSFFWLHCASYVFFLRWVSHVPEFVMVVGALTDTKNKFSCVISFWFCPLGEKE